MTTIRKLTLNKWRQFNSIDIDFSNRVTILTGSNGCGKTTLLNILGRHFGWGLAFISTPSISKKLKRKIHSDFWELFNDDLPQTNSVIIGKIEYEDGSVCNLTSPPNVGIQYDLQYHGRKNLNGILIPSHRPITSYHSVQNIPASPKTNAQQYQEFQQFVQQTYGSSTSRNPGQVLKESLISLALFGYGNQSVAGNSEYRELFEDFQKKLSLTLPKSLGFEKIEIRMPEVVLITKTGEFCLDAMSGGVSAIFGITWQLLMYGSGKSNTTILIDEPENHLHPSMQREFLVSLAKAIPEYKFIVATHSPFIISSMDEASVYALKYNESSKIDSTLLNSVDLSASPNVILKEILDVPTVLPIWVEGKIANIFNKHNNIHDEKQKIEQIYSDLKANGLFGKVGE